MKKSKKRTNDAMPEDAGGLTRRERRYARIAEQWWPAVQQSLAKQNDFQVVQISGAFEADRPKLLVSLNISPWGQFNIEQLRQRPKLPRALEIARLQHYLNRLLPEPLSVLEVMCYSRSRTEVFARLGWFREGELQITVG
jgi:hypothetical protein